MEEKLLDITECVPGGIYSLVDNKNYYTFRLGKDGTAKNVPFTLPGHDFTRATGSHDLDSRTNSAFKKNKYKVATGYYRQHYIESEILGKSVPWKPETERPLTSDNYLIFT